MGVIKLSDVKSCPNASNFYHKYREQITRVKTIHQRNSLLSDMNEDFERHVRAYPQERNEISETYQLLKKKCMEA